VSSENDFQEPSSSLGARLSELFAWCGGAQIQLVREFPEERSRLAAIGATVFFTGLFATVSSAYALFYVFKDSSWVPVLALFWGSMIFNLDRFIVMTIHGDLSRRRWLTAVPRLILATVIALVVARPLELWIFSPEIDQALKLEKITAKSEADDTFAKSQTDAGKRYRIEADNFRSEAGTEQAQDAVTHAKEEETTNCEAAAEQLKIYNEELTGSPSKGIPHGDGKVASVKWSVYLDLKKPCDTSIKDRKRAEGSLKTLESKISAQLVIKNKEQAGASTQARDLLSSKKAALDDKNADSLLARHRQLTKLASQEPAVKSMTLFIAALFWLVEALPVLSKLMAGTTIYDIRVAERLDAALEVARGSREAAHELRDAGRLKTTLRAESLRTEAKAAKNARKEAIELHFRAIREVIRAAHKKWYVPMGEVEVALAQMVAVSRIILKEAQAIVNASILSANVKGLAERSKIARLFFGAAFTCGLALGAVYETFSLLHGKTGFAKTDLAIAIAVGCLVATLLTVGPFTKLLSRLFKSDPGDKE
jgi:hypothetical protein